MRGTGDGKAVRFAIVLFCSGLPGLLLPRQVFPAVTGPLAVGVAANGNCRFHGSPGILSFGSLDPTSGRDVGAAARLMFKCTKGATWRVSDDGGLHEASPGSYRLRHAFLDAHIPYLLRYGNDTGTSQGANIEQFLTVDGLIRAGSYPAAPVGSYADTVTVTLSP